MVKWHPKNKKYYTSRGYKFTKMGDEFNVDIKDLLLQSHSEIIVICDYCGEEYKYKYQNYTNRCSPNLPDSCPRCRKIKIQQSVKLKYGVNSVFQLEEIKNKSKNTLKNKYGVEYYSQTEEYKNSNVREKAIATMKNNNNIPISSQEKAVCDLLENIYGKEFCHRCFLLSNIAMDCMIEIQNIKIDIEYDGWYFHKDRQIQDRKRDEFVKSQGFKVLRIKARREVPSKEQLIENINNLINTKHTYAEIILDIR